MTKNVPVDVFRHIDMRGGPDACWPWLASTSANGRPYFTAKGVRKLAYQWTHELATGAAPGKGQMLLHSCDNKLCCNPKHLRLGSHQENMDDMKQRERHGLPHNTVRVIKKLLREGRKHESIAELFGLSREQITHINNGRAYAHVKEQEDGASQPDGAERSGPAKDVEG